ncbi:hypothetical protein Tco_0859712 [Tanacetum coccineum]|uniref:Integrase, catalytic region, zinc finger, CCHC-type, peptidase aspartic, catalytic n=1 Tax=Tanacetum coccineum TaxID=301880 RepID=A0ABQ5BCU0_9ASTR
MANLSEDIQCAGSDTRPPMLDRTDFASWQQRIRLYCRGKENGVNILKSIDEGPFQMGTFRETLSEGNEGALHLGPERPRYFGDLPPLPLFRPVHLKIRIGTKPQFKMAGLWFRMSRVDRIEDKVTMHGVTGHIARNYTHPSDPQNSNTQNKMLLIIVLSRMSAFGMKNNYYFLQVDKTTLLMKMWHDLLSLFMMKPVPSYDSDILSEVHDHDTIRMLFGEHHEEHEMHDDVQSNYIVDSHANYTSNSNMISYDQYVKDNAMPVVQSNVSSVTNDAYMMIYNDMCEPHASPGPPKTTQNIVVGKFTNC